MALEGGSALEGTGLAGAIAAARKSVYGKKYRLKDDAASIDAEAQAIVDYLVANAEVVVTAGIPVTVNTGTGEGETTDVGTGTLE